MPPNKKQPKIPVSTGLEPDLEHIVLETHGANKGIELLIEQGDKNNPLPALEALVSHTDATRQHMSDLKDSLKPQTIGDTMMFHVKGVKGDKGDRGEKGDTGIAPTRKEILDMIMPLIPAAIIPENGKDGRDGKDGKSVDYSEVIKDLLAIIKTPQDGKDGKDGKDAPDVTHEQIQKALKGLKISYNDLEDRPIQIGNSSTWGVGFLHEISDVNISNPQDTQVLTYDAATRAWINKNASGGGGGGTWGSITGTLSDQTDLQTALNAKQVNISLTTTGTSGAATFDGTTLNIPQYTGSGGGVSTVASADGSVAVTGTTAIDLAVVKAPKWTTARSLAGNSVDGSANVAFANKFIVQGTADAGLSAAQFLGALGTGILKNTTTTGILSIAVAGDFPTLNQNTTGTAAALTTGRTISITGDIAYTSPTFDGSGNVTAAGTLATVNTNTGTFGSATQSVQFTVNGKGLITAATNLTITPAVGSITGLGTGIATWLTTPSSANLAAAITDETGSGALVFANAPSLTGANLDTTTIGVTQAAGDSSTKLATTAFVANAILGQDFKEACKYATTGTLPSIIYNNGSSGVGATLTGVGFGAISIDSSTPSVGDRLLVKNQVSTFQNGIYTVTTVGNVAAVFVLTRTADFNQGSEIDTGDSVFVSAGSTLSTTTWAYNGIDNPTMGTTAITFAQTAGQGSFTAGNGISITGVSIAIDTSITVDKTTAQTLTNKNLTSGTNTFPTFNQNTTGSAATLTTPRAINGVNFDGSAAITVTAAAGTLSGATLNATVLASSLTSVGTLASLTVTGNILNSALGGSKVVFTDSSKNLTSTGIGTSAQFIKGDGSLDSSTYITANQTITLSGDVTGSGTTAITTAIAASVVTGKVLTGYVSGAGTVAATDSILQAIQKLNGNVAAITTPTGANPTASVGLAAVNGSASTFMRSDGAPALSQSIAPTWTGVHIFTPAVRSSGVASYFTVNAPADTGQTTATESIGVKFAGATRTWADGTVATQREFSVQAPTYNKTTTSATFTKAATFAISGAPLAGTSVTITSAYALWVQAGITQLDGTLVVAGHVTVEGVTSTGATGTGKFVFDTSPTLASPTFTAPVLGTPASGVMTNVTGTATGLTSGITNALASATTTVNVSSATAPTTGQVLTATSGTAATWQTPTGGAPKMRLSTDFGSTTRVATTNGGSGTGGAGAATGVTGTTGTTANSFSQTIFGTAGTSSFSKFLGNPTFSLQALLTTKGTTADAYWGIGNVNAAGTSFDYTTKHVGFKMSTSGSVAQLFATQGDGTTETASAALLTMNATVSYDLIVVIDSTNNKATYYYQANGGGYSNTVLSTHFPTSDDGLAGLAYVCVGNHNAASSTAIACGGFNYER